MMNDTQLLSQIGQALYGVSWEHALSRQVSVSDRSMRRWASGTDAIPWGVWRDVYLEVESRLATLSYWKEELYRRVVITPADQVAESFDPKHHWLFEVHDPESGRHSLITHKVLSSLAEVVSEMKRHPGMIFKVTVPPQATAEEREAFGKMNIAKF